MKQDYQLKITLHFLLASLAEQENNDQNTVLTCKRIGGGENLEFMSYIPFSKFITRLSLGSKNYSYKLNERHYGALQGLNKDETRKKYGENQVLLWRRSADVRPPSLTKDDLRYPGNDPKYSNLKESELPLTENLVDTIKRVVEYYNSDIKKELEQSKKVIIVAHGNSLRGLMKYLDNFCLLYTSPSPRD